MTLVGRPSNLNLNISCLPVRSSRLTALQHDSLRDSERQSELPSHHDRRTATVVSAMRDCAVLLDLPQCLVSTQTFSVIGRSESPVRPA